MMIAGVGKTPALGYGLTTRQLQVLDFVRATVANDRRPPSLREIADAVGISLSNVHRVLASLRRRGQVDWMPHAPRSLCIAEAGGLSTALHHRLAAYCAASGDRIADVISDAVLLHLDELERVS